uniref:Uncharacterized protein n=1 Tax=Candidatus Kentrum sp. TC TaxID=2126339 RepID=A0A450ZK69_9GAMM|nr:MAG: hypothetical protein BECKTC1821F_GA0114240_100415 [Candidatus Kentron sp. TC]
MKFGRKLNHHALLFYNRLYVPFKLCYRVSFLLFSLYGIFFTLNASVILVYYNQHYLNFIRPLFSLLKYGNLAFVSIITIWWGMAAYMLFALISICSKLITHIIYEENWKHVRIYNKYHSFFGDLLRPILNVSTIIFLLPAAIYLLHKTGWDPTIQDLERIVFDLSYLAVPIVFLAYWVVFLRMRTIKKTSSIDFFLFSKIAIRNNLISIIAIMIFLGFLGNILIPALLHFLQFFENEVTHALIEKIEFLDENASLKSDFLSISVLEDFMYLGYIETIAFQNKMFTLLVVVSFVGFFLPLLLKYYFFGKGVKMLLSYALKSTIASTVLVLFVTFFIQRAYYIDTSNIINSSSSFIFLLSYFFMLDTLKIEDPPPNKVLQRMLNEGRST